MSKKLCIIFLVIFIPISFVEAQEYLKFKDKISDAFIPNTNARAVYNLWFGATMRFTLGDYVIVNGNKQTYVDEILVIEERQNFGQTWRFGLKFSNEGAAFNFFQDIKNQLALFVRVETIASTWAASFEDGLIMAQLSGINVIFTFVVKD